jgi:hypothetical protein
MSVLQRYQDRAVIDADRRAVREGEIIEARRQADVVDDQIALARRNDVADLVLDGFEDLLGLLDAGAGRSADMKLDLPAVDDRKEVAPDERYMTVPRASIAMPKTGTMIRRVSKVARSSA